jgi:hypothetical protein
MAFGKPMSWAFVFVGSFVLFGDRAAADGDLRCQDRLLSNGSSAYEVQSLCGAPDMVAHRVEVRTVRRPVAIPCNNLRGPRDCVAVRDELVEIAIEEWTYDFGPQRFLQFLTFEQGKLVEVRSGGYGHKVT